MKPFKRGRKRTTAAATITRWVVRDCPTLAVELIDYGLPSLKNQFVVVRIIEDRSAIESRHIKKGPAEAAALKLARKEKKTA